MKTNRQSKARVLILGACALPLAAVGASHMNSSTSVETRQPAAASIAPTLSRAKPPEGARAVRVEWADAWHESVRLRSTDGGVADPFYRAAAEQTHADRDPNTAVHGEPTPETEHFAHSLDGMMGGEEPVAIIDGRVRRLGDEIGDGWLIAAIDPEARTVTLKMSDGTERILREN